MKILPLYILISMACPNPTHGQGLGLPSIEILEQKATERGTITIGLPPHDPTDYLQPPIGEVRQYERKIITRVRADIAEVIEGVPVGAAWLTKANLIQQDLDEFVVSGLRRDFLKVAPHISNSFREVNFLPSDQRSPLSEKYGWRLFELSISVQTEIYNLVKEKGGVLSDQEWESISQVALFRSLWSMKDWEDNPKYLTAPGGFIVDATEATANLKTQPLSRIKAFLGDVTDNSFFERYETNGDGMDILKTKYAANKAAIQAKFAEVVTYAAELETQQ